MNVTNYRQVVILSAFRVYKSKYINELYSESLMEELIDTGLTFFNTQGCFNGELEDSFMVLVNNDTDISKIKDIAFREYDQESVLYQDSDGDCYMIYRDNTMERLGKLRASNKSEALYKGDYTIFNDTYYTVRT